MTFFHTTFTDVTQEKLLCIFQRKYYVAKFVLTLMALWAPPLQNSVNLEYVVNGIFKDQNEETQIEKLRSVNNLFSAE